MRKLVLGTTMLLTFVGTGDAAFRPAQPPPVVGGSYECAIVGRDPDEQGHDPFYKVVIYIDTQQSKPTSMNVEHVSASGRRVSRSDQYSINASFSYESEKMKLTWVGQFKDKPKMMMVGAFIFSDHQWHYNEQLSVGGGKPELVTKSLCHSVEPE